MLEPEVAAAEEAVELDEPARASTGFDAVRSTDDQVAQAIDRAQRQMAGLPVGPAIAISMVIGVQ